MRWILYLRTAVVRRSVYSNVGRALSRTPELTTWPDTSDLVRPPQSTIAGTAQVDSSTQILRKSLIVVKHARRGSAGCKRLS
jgi:hypothetical protein